MADLEVRVKLGERSYSIKLTDNFAGIGDFVLPRSKGKLAFLVTDENIISHARQVQSSLEHCGLTTHLVVLPPGEEQKSLATASRLYDELLDLAADRHTLVVAVGGGVIGDLAGFVASTYTRGLPLVMIPTTLLAMVDSSVGGKVAVNHPRAKNMIGTFHQPVGVWIATSTLNTLPDREYRSGLAEVVKYGMILDASFFEFLEENVEKVLDREPGVLGEVLARCCQLKADVVELDEREETGHRAILNYGHTFAHAFETAAGYGTWLHGEAVAAGMMCAAHLAQRKGLITSQLVQRQHRLLEAFGLPIRPEAWSMEALLKTMRNDKKAIGGKLRFILPISLGEVALFGDISEAEVKAVLAEMMNP